MSVSLPSMSMLRAFEAVARRRSFALAASELNLTASAVSHQIAKLESQVGVRLLDRTTASVRLSGEGEQYLQKVSGALGAISAATQDLRLGFRNSLYLHVSPSLASLWLMPRLADFAQSHPDISLHLSASHIHSDFAVGQTDLDIRYGVPRWPDLEVEPLFTERILPLANPQVALQYRRTGPAALLSAPLIQSTVSIVQWRDWLAAHGVPKAPERYSLRFDRAQLSLDAAVQGLGVALESATMAANHLREGRLVPLFGARRALKIEGHFVVYPTSHQSRPALIQFMSWLRQQIRRMPDPLGKR